jgi:hypothetical protein
VSEKQKAGAVEEFKKNCHPIKSQPLVQSESFLKQWKKFDIGVKTKVEWGYTQFKEGN